MPSASVRGCFGARGYSLSQCCSFGSRGLVAGSLVGMDWLEEGTDRLLRPLTNWFVLICNTFWFDVYSRYSGSHTWKSYKAIVGDEFNTL